jgi:hypothetical protein
VELTLASNRGSTVASNAIILIALQSHVLKTEQGDDKPKTLQSVNLTVPE